VVEIATLDVQFDTENGSGERISRRIRDQPYRAVSSISSRVVRSC
jgi:hypothetical protein